MDATQQAGQPQPIQQPLQEGQMGFDNQKVQSHFRDFSQETFRRFAGKANHIFRICFYTPTIVMRMVHSHNRLTRRCLDFLGWCPGCVDGNVKAAQDKYGANIIVYPTDAQGNPVAVGNEAHYPAGIYFWKFGADKYVDIRTIVTQCGNITGFDLLITTKDEQFQKLGIAPCLENRGGALYPSCWYTADANLKAFYDAKIKTDCYPLDKVTAKQVSENQMITDFNLDPRLLAQKPNLQKPAFQQPGQPTYQDTTVAPAPAAMPNANLAQLVSTPVQTPAQVKEEVKIWQENKAQVPAPATPKIAPATPVQPQTAAIAYYTTDAQRQVIEVTHIQMQKLVEANGISQPAMPIDKSSGWKTAADFGFEVLIGSSTINMAAIKPEPKVVLPPPPTPIQPAEPFVAQPVTSSIPATTPVQPGGGAFDQLFADLNQPI